MGGSLSFSLNDAAKWIVRNSYLFLSRQKEENLLYSMQSISSSNKEITQRNFQLQKTLLSITERGKKKIESFPSILIAIFVITERIFFSLDS